MPLSEHEQRILAELEESLSKADPRFAKSVRDTSVYTHSGRRVRWGVLGFLLGLGILLWQFQYSLVAGLFGIVIMFASMFVIERNARRLGRASWHDFRHSLRSDVTTKSSLEDRKNSLKEWIDRRRRSE
jgi:hypothetical protein